MEIVSQRNYANTIPANMAGKMPENHRSQVSKNINMDILADPYEQGVQFAKDLGFSFSPANFRENMVSSDLDKIKAQGQAAKRELSYTDDLVNGLRTKRSVTEEKLEDGRPHIKSVSDLIENIHSGYQKQYGKVIKGATEFMQDMNTALGKISSHIQAGSDGKIKFNGKAAILDIDKTVSKYAGLGFWEDTNHKPSLDNFFGNWEANISNAKLIIQIPETKGALDFWEKKLSGQGFIVKGNGTNINIYPDFKPIKEIYSSIKNISIEWRHDNIMVQEFQSLQTAIDSQKNAINSSVSRLLETFRQDNSHFETLVQLLIQLVKDLNQNNSSLVNM